MAMLSRGSVRGAGAHILGPLPGGARVQINFRTWPADGYWYFDPLAWQLVFVLGFVLAKDDGLGALVAIFRPLRAIGIALVILGFGLATIDFEPDPTRMPNPKLFSSCLTKHCGTPARLLHFLALAITFAGRLCIRSSRCRSTRTLHLMLGRNSLNVFCIGGSSVSAHPSRATHWVAVSSWICLC